MSSQTTESSPIPKSRTLDLSARQLADAAYRALRVAGVSSGVAVDAARDVVELERTRGCGLDLLDRVLQVGPPLLVASCQADAGSTDLPVGGASALLLASPLVALVCEQVPTTLTVRGLAQGGALEPALRRRAQAGGLRFVLATSEGTPVLCVRPTQSTIRSGWSGSWAAPLDVRLSVADAQAPLRAQRADSVSERRLTVDRETWDRVHEQSLGYLV